MTEVHASAPAKMVLCGEYAVLQGAPALATAVDRRARVTLGRAKGRENVLRSPGYAAGEWRFRHDAHGRITWLDEPPAPGGFALIEAVWRRVDVGSSSGLSVTIDTREFHDPASGEKLGLGSSAAVAAALSTAAYQLGDRHDNAFDIAMAAHLDYQDGHGSGVDVATSCHGGTIEFSSGRIVRDVSWPRGLRPWFFWSGRPASTAEKLRALECNGASRRADSQANRLIDAAAAAAEAWEAGDSRQVVTEFRRYSEALRRFDVDHGLGIFDAGHRELAELAGHPGVVYKPCGAGGGDVGVLLASDDAVAGEFADQAARHGFSLLELAPGAPGATAGQVPGS